MINFSIYKIKDGKFQFPKDFLWGTATAGHQVEGWNKHSDWWVWEQKGLIRDGNVSGKAVDYWNRYEEDHSIMSRLGCTGFRLGIEWAKVEPEPGKFSDEVIDRYRLILSSLKNRGIKICLTLNHWVLPQWVAEQKDWLNQKTIDDIEKFAKHVISSLGEYPDLWVTLNEPLVLTTLGNMMDEFPPQRKSFKAYLQTTTHMLEAHARLYHLIHELKPNAPDGSQTKVGIAQAYPYIVPWKSGLLTGLYEEFIAKIYRLVGYEAWDYSILKGKTHFLYGNRSIKYLKNSCDFCGINYYFRVSLKFNLSKNSQLFIENTSIPPGIEKTQMGWQVYPPGLYYMIRHVWNRFQKPIYITENGIADDTDTMRPKYIIQHLLSIQHAIHEGIPVKGFFYWSFMDNFEWREGFAKKFGLIAVDYKDPELRRVLRRSAYLYADIIRENGITREIVKNYSPEIYDSLFENR